MLSRIAGLFRNRTREWESVNPQLAELLKAHGVEAKPQGDWLLVTGGLRAIRGVLLPSGPGQQNCIWQLDVQARLATGELMVESCGGFGFTPALGAADTLGNFSLGSLHVMLAAFWSVDVGDQISVERWESAEGNVWDVFVGNVVPRMQKGTASTLASEPLVECYNTIVRLIAARDLAGNCHWLRVYYANISPANQVVEVLFDNETWLEAEAAIRALPWSRPEYFYSVRWFSILQRPAIRIFFPGER